MKKLTILFIFAAFAVISLSAQTANYQDVVYLKNGSTVRGIIVEQQPGISLKIETADGNIFVFNIGDVEKIAKEKILEKAGVSPGNASSELSQPVYRYMFGKPINPNGGRKSPALAGWMSFLIPGVGQWINGDTSAGWFFFSASIICDVWFLSSLEITEGYYGDIHIELNPLPTMIALGLSVWATVDGASRARHINRARGFALSNGMYLNVKPAIMRNDILQSGISINPSDYSYGLKMNLTF